MYEKDQGETPWGSQSVRTVDAEGRNCSRGVENLQKRRLQWAEFAFASPREPPDKISARLDALERAMESPSDLDTRVLEREAMPSRVSKTGIVAVTSQFAAPWNTRTQWSCIGFICGLTRTASACDEVVVNGYWSKRRNGTTTGVIELDLHIRGGTLEQEEQSRE